MESEGRWVIEIRLDQETYQGLEEHRKANMGKEAFLTFKGKKVGETHISDKADSFYIEGDFSTDRNEAEKFLQTLLKD
ncbi:MAG: hypothetical protein HY998_02730 [candidate division NC10 bacterium]|nr:hypothetical protein [candidate division NC10 bacterium]